MQNHDMQSRETLATISTVYLQQLLHQNLDRFLNFPPASRASLGEAPLDSVPDGAELSPLPLRSCLELVEPLLLQHQQLVAQSGVSRHQLRQVESELFGRLGLQLKPEQVRSRLLLVDDSLEVLRLLRTMLGYRGYEVYDLANSELAFARAYELQPDLILLDILMPQLDGYTICQQLKQNPRTAHIPVVFISAIDQPVDKVKAFGLGAMDYISKPFQIEEVWARVEHQLSLAELRSRLEAQNVRLQQELQFRSQSHPLPVPQADPASQPDSQPDPQLPYQQLFEHAVDGMYQTSLEGRFLRVNPALAQMLGYSCPETLVTSIDSVAQQVYVEPSRRSEFLQYLHRHGAIAQFESQVYRQDGTTLWISESARSITDLQGNWIGYEGTIRDVTQQRLEQQQFWRQRLQVERSLLKLILAHCLNRSHPIEHVNAQKV